MPLFDQMQAAIGGNMMGNQLGHSAMQGMMPSVGAPRGSQQLSLAAMSAVRELIQKSNLLADSLRRAGCEEEDREVIKITHQYQGVLDKLKARLQDMQQGGMNAA